ncbi:MAG TPA: bifunctional hydroxymethylpyrimidine kinase/phosphomethylpyrimidine kinase [Acidimicrobiales bacterium]|nr:bifunctional hydroxymethylpyrimidine kinase/phosphomethylpyrimidine kinase [Acidimicrobiales bacterium]
MTATPKVALTIAGSDSGGGAGIAADLKTFAAHGVLGTLAITAVTAQNTLGVQGVQTITPAMVAAQIDSVVTDLHPAAAKTGMLATPEIVKVVVAKAGDGTLPVVVVDPVLVASSGDPLFDGDEIRTAYLELVATATVVTPNLPEAGLLVGRQLDSVESMSQAARELQSLGPSLVVVKGGHLPGREAVDVAFDGQAVTLLRGRWVETRNNHGTGCSFSAAIAAQLARGLEPLEAALEAKAFVHRAIELAAGWQLGGGHGPIDHLGAAVDPAPSREGAP